MTNEEMLDILNLIDTRLCFASEIFGAGGADKKTMNDEARLVKELQPQVKLVISSLKKRGSESQ